MKNWLIILAVSGFCNIVQAGWRDAEFALLPTPQLDGAAAMVSVPFGHGTTKKLQCAEPVGAVEVEESTWTKIATHIENNSGKYATAITLIASYLAYANTNDKWPFDKSHEDTDTLVFGADGITIQAKDSQASSVVIYDSSGKPVNVALNGVNGIQVQIGEKRPVEETVTASDGTVTKTTK
jgi:hypothetical protein